MGTGGGLCEDALSKDVLCKKLRDILGVARATGRSSCTLFLLLMLLLSPLLLFLSLPLQPQSPLGVLLTVLFSFGEALLSLLSQGKSLKLVLFLLSMLLRLLPATTVVVSLQPEAASRIPFAPRVLRLSLTLLLLSLLLLPPSQLLVIMQLMSLSAPLSVGA